MALPERDPWRFYCGSCLGVAFVHLLFGTITLDDLQNKLYLMENSWDLFENITPRGACTALLIHYNKNANENRNRQRKRNHEFK